MNHNKKRIYFLCGCFFLTLLIAFAFLPVITFDYIGYDDAKYVSNNPYVQEGLNKQSIYWAFTTKHASNWHPLTWLSYMLDNSLFGNKPGIYHWTNLNFHIVNTLLLFLIMTQMTGHIFRSFIVAALFGVHPLHVESVVWISERKDVLSTCMILFSLYAYVKYVNLNEKKYYILLLLFYLLSLLSKPMMVTYPFVLLLLDYWPLYRMKSLASKFILEKIPLFIMAFIFCLITLWTQYSGGACQSLETISMTTRILNAIAAYGWYVNKLFAPINLAVFYPHPQTNVPLISVIWGAVLIIIGIYCAIGFRYSFPYIMTGFCWFLGTLFPVIGLVQVGLQAYADRYTYVPLIGLFIVITWGVFDILLKISGQNKRSFKWGAAVFVSIILILTYHCSLQVRTWKNGTSVFQHALKVVPDNFVAMTHLGTIPLLKKAVQLRPNYIPALYNLGTALIHKGKKDEALTYLLKAANLNAKHPNIYNNLGGIYYEQKKYTLSLLNFQKALTLNPHHVSAQKNIQKVYEKISKKKDCP